MKRYIRALIYIFLILIIFIALKSYNEIRPIRRSLHSIVSDALSMQVTDREGVPLVFSLGERWNRYDNLLLHNIPKFLIDVFIFSEDKRFYQHSGVDWYARSNAMWQNLVSWRIVRGASTITEQVVRMINPRPRTLWSKWLEGIEAIILERSVSKADIIEFYLNQIPYASNRRGVLQASYHYFDRDLATLSTKEILALAVLARAPSAFDLYKGSEKFNSALQELANSLAEAGLLSKSRLLEIKSERLELKKATPPVNAFHFVRYLREDPSAVSTHGRSIRTTIDGELQRDIQRVVDERLGNLKKRSLQNAAALVVDHSTDEILAWVVGGADQPDTPAGQIDAVTVARQPGSALKPFLYASALDAGWTAASIIDDSPLSEAIGAGLHRFKNYSNIFYGKVTLRESLANSLNIPAIHTINYVGIKKYLSLLHTLGFESLRADSDIYDEGLALGNGEVTLYELVRGYAVLARNGVYRPLSYLMDNNEVGEIRQIYSKEAASLIGNILSDPWARRLEFGSGSILNLPIQSAVKTGTSTDYCDAWAVGYNDRYVVGVWMGNLDHSPTDGITGSTGPALVLRSIFARLNRNRKTGPLYLSPKLVPKDICYQQDQLGSCLYRTEYFVDGAEYTSTNNGAKSPEFIRPTPGLQLAVDPRIPKDLQKFEFQIAGVNEGEKVSWILNGVDIGQTDQSRMLWGIKHGKFALEAVIHHLDNTRSYVPKVQFSVR